VFKRLFWLSVGLAIGFGSSFWLFRLVRETMARYTPEQLADDLASAMRRLAADVRAAAAEGAQAMREAEAELRASTRPS
jgi:hypothetical protein